MTPKNGGKIELKLGQSGTSAAEYLALLQTHESSFRTTVRVGAEVPGKVEFGAWESELQTAPPEWLLSDARAALKAALRTSEVDGRWPRRIARWRPEPVA